MPAVPAWFLVVVLEDPHSTPAATGEIDRTGLGQTDTVTKATPRKRQASAPPARSQQGAGQLPQGATDCIQTQRHWRRSAPRSTSRANTRPLGPRDATRSAVGRASPVARCR